MKKICVFGANGQTEIELVKKSIKNNASIRAAVRNEESMKDFKKDIEVIPYSFENPFSVRAAMNGCDIIVSVIGSGSGKDAATPTTLYSNSVYTIIQEMLFLNLKRLIVISSAGVEYDEKAPWYYRYLFRPMLMNSYMDMMKMETIIEQYTQNINWTIVRPTYLLNGKSKDYLIKNRKIGEGNFKINRIDTAEFILTESLQNKWVHQYPVLGYSK
ncbi:NAD(P)H-binding protein [Spongiimicrobium salis]|uniref:NAD(P)H-binding protein n=1 Tax=Spongiimicrobium salis TaxID=1667022 RepID=UPI00374CE110